MKIDFTKDELQVLLLSLDSTVKQGGLQVVDRVIPVSAKVQQALMVIDAQKEEPRTDKKVKKPKETAKKK